MKTRMLAHMVRGGGFFLSLTAVVYAAPPQRPEDVRVVPPATLSPTVSPGARWLFIGDSETSGRAGGTQLNSQRSAFIALWALNGFAVPSNIGLLADGGRTLFDHQQEYNGYGSRADRTWVHFQESGNQESSQGEQDPVEDYAATFETFVRDIATRSPNAVISVETAYSFGRENTSGQKRNWTHYNTAMAAKIEALRAEFGPGKIIRVAEADRYILELVQLKSTSTVLMPDGGHFRGIGNYMVALSMFEGLGYDVSALNTAGVTEISMEDKQLCLDIIRRYHERSHVRWDLSPTANVRVEYTLFRAASTGAFTTVAGALSDGNIQKYQRVIPWQPINFPVGTHYVRVAARNLAGEYSGFADDASLQVVVTDGGTNVAPIVSAGLDRAVTLPASASLYGSVSDDGLPSSPGAVTMTWTRVSGPGTVTFSAPSAADTSASFSSPGTYILRLAASDGELSNQDDVQVTVNNAPPPSITTSSLPNGMIGISYSASLAATGGRAPYTFELISSSPANDWLVTGSNGGLSGVPTDAVGYQVSFRVADADGATADKALTLNIQNNPSLPPARPRRLRAR